MTTPVLPADLPALAASAGRPGTPAEEGVFAGVLAEVAAPAADPLTDALPPLPPGDGPASGAVEAAGLLSAQVLGLVPPALLTTTPTAVTATGAERVPVVPAPAGAVVLPPVPASVASAGSAGSAGSAASAGSAESAASAAEDPRPPAAAPPGPLAPEETAPGMPVTAPGMPVTAPGTPVTAAGAAASPVATTAAPTTGGAVPALLRPGQVQSDAPGALASTAQGDTPPAPGPLAVGGRLQDSLVPTAATASDPLYGTGTGLATAPAPLQDSLGAALAAAPGASPDGLAGDAVPRSEPDPVTDQAPPLPALVPAQPVPGTTPAPSAPAPLLSLAAEHAPAQVQPAVSELARGLRDAGGGRASLVVRLDPPELGPVLVRLTVRDGVVEVQLRATEAVAASGLLAATADVRATLADHGLDLSSFEVQHGDLPGDDAAPGSRSGSPDQGTHRRDESADRSTGAPAGVTTTETTSDAPPGTWL